MQELIVTGGVLPGGDPSEEAERQIQLSVCNQCLLAGSLADAGFTPVIDYVITSRARLDAYREGLRVMRLFLVTLAPGAAAALERDRQRPEKTVAHQWLHLEAIIRGELEGIGLWIDNSCLSVDETARAVLARADEARV